jgi:phenylalanyl-tRNA synthetase beta subunit
MEQIFKQLNLSIIENLLFSDVQRSFTPYRSAELYLPDNSILGTFGQINPY